MENIINNLESKYLKFKLGEEQRDVLLSIFSFINNPDERQLTLCGKAGTGKTSILLLVVEYLKLLGLPYQLVAPTHKAKQVLSKSTDNDVMTVHQLLALKANINILDLDLNDIEEFAVHECIHYLQEIKDKRNNLLRMGLCDYSEFKIYGLGLNEAAVQLMSAKIIGIPKDYVKYFGINFETISPSYYPLECCLINQLAYITGENVLFESTINSNNNFKNTFSDLTSPKTFMTIQNAIDDILFKEEEIIFVHIDKIIASKVIY